MVVMEQGCGGGCWGGGGGAGSIIGGGGSGDEDESDSQGKQQCIPVMFGNTKTLRM